jgi:hypothetical protein
MQQLPADSAVSDMVDNPDMFALIAVVDLLL